jgi:tRNA pseudouridine55 synthase
MATGVLVLGVGRATRLLGHLMLTEKAYDATIRLGAVTTTDDAEGEVLSTAPTDGLDEGSIRSVLGSFVGGIDQVPTAVSAIKVDGVRAYQRVRDGEHVELEPRRVTIHELTVDEISGPDVRISVRCSSGTYIRAIARDAGAALGVGGHLTGLRRTAVGEFGLDRARSLDRLADEFEMVPIAEAARRTFTAIDLDEDEAQDVRFGRALQRPLPGLTAVFAPDGEFLALYEPREGQARAVAVFV